MPDFGFIYGDFALRKSGFSLIELLATILVLSIITVTIVPKFLSFELEARKTSLQQVSETLRITNQQVATAIILGRGSFNTSGARFTMEDGTRVSVKGGQLDGRWNTTFGRLLDTEHITLSSTNTCYAETPWCARVKGQRWFANRQLSQSGSGRGVIIYPSGNNLNSDACYVYFLNPNSQVNPTEPQGVIINTDFSEC